MWFNPKEYTLGSRRITWAWTCWNWWVSNDGEHGSQSTQIVHTGIANHMCQMEKAEDGCHKAIALHQGLSWAFAIEDQSRWHFSWAFWLCADIWHNTCHARQLHSMPFGYVEVYSPKEGARCNQGLFVWQHHCFWDGFVANGLFLLGCWQWDDQWLYLNSQALVWSGV